MHSGADGNHEKRGERASVCTFSMKHACAFAIAKDGCVVYVYLK